MHKTKMFKSYTVVVQRIVCGRPLLEVDKEFHKNTHYVLHFYRQNFINKIDLSLKSASKTTKYFDAQCNLDKIKLSIKVYCIMQWSYENCFFRRYRRRLYRWCCWLVGLLVLKKKLKNKNMRFHG